MPKRAKRDPHLRRDLDLPLIQGRFVGVFFRVFVVVGQLDDELGVVNEDAVPEEEVARGTVDAEGGVVGVEGAAEAGEWRAHLCLYAAAHGEGLGGSVRKAGLEEREVLWRSWSD